jgi:hypothetical protein
MRTAAVADAEASAPARIMTEMNFVFTDALDESITHLQFTRIVGIETTAS